MDVFAPEKRSEIMSRVRGKHTGPEEKMAALLKAAKRAAFQRHAADLPGKPDFVYRKLKIAIFVHGCFWHGCPRHLRRPSSNMAYWQKKIDGNIRRDKKHRRLLRKTGWSALTVWEHDLKQPANVINKVERKILSRKKSGGNS